MAEKKFPIKWWEDCLRNAKISLSKEESALAAQEDRVIRLRANIEFEERRVMKAKANKRDSYSDNYSRKDKPCGLN